jgi:glycosyltransferase involved in cell wall biosynthesis
LDLEPAKTFTIEEFGNSGASIPNIDSPNSPIRLALTIPVYNEEERIASCVQTLDLATRNWGFDTTLIVAEDGSTDRTREVLQTLKTEFSRLVILSDQVRRGRGYALRRAWRDLDADVFAFTDADLPGGTEAILRTVLAAAHGADVATASRYAPGAITDRPVLRELVSRAYNGMVRQLFRENIYDHQCGIKAFGRESMPRIFDLTREDSWFWDTEALVVSARKGLKVAELPVHWTETRYNRTPIRRLFSDIFLHGSSLLRLFVNFGGSQASIPRSEIRASGPHSVRKRGTIPQNIKAHG